MAQQRATSRSRAKKARAARPLGISPLLFCLLIMVGSVFLYSVYLELGGKEVPQAAVYSFIDKDADLSIHYIDVGQGDCSLIMWEGAAVLIDCGEKEYAQTVLDYLDKQGVERLDCFITTHPHSDHMGGAYEIVPNIDIDKVIAPKVSADMTPTSKVYQKFLTALQDKALKMTAAKMGTVFTLTGRTAASTEKKAPQLEILAPVKDYDDLNNYSVAVRLTYGSTAYLFTGDIEKKAEKDIIGTGADLSADVLKVAHHGSSSSTGDGFLEEVSPEICVIQCGDGNSYGHPHAETLDKLKDLGAKIYRTDQNGTVAVYSDGEKVYVTTEK